MKHFVLGLLVFLSIIAVSCTDNDSSLGFGIQPPSDIISFTADTFHVATDTMLVDYIYAMPDSFLLGNYYNETFGSTRADIFAQLKAPVNFKFPDGARPDSAKIIISYYSWFGDSNSPMRISIYEMKGTPFSFTGLYPSNINVNDYADFTKPLASQVVVAKDTERGDSTLIMFDLSSTFVTNFFNESAYASDAAFFNFFKGLYITTDFGTSTMLSIANIRLNYYYSYDILDGTTTRTHTVSFPANREVRQVNRIEHSNRDVIKSGEEKSYVASPANVFTRLKIPLRKMAEKMKNDVDNNKLVLNSALLQVEVADYEPSNLTLKPSRYMLLIKESTLKNNYERSKIPTSANDTASIYAEYLESLDFNGDTIRYYPFNLSMLIATELKNAEQNNRELPETLDMVLLPFVPDYTSAATQNISWAKHMVLMSGTAIKGGANADSPMRIRTVYSGF